MRIFENIDVLCYGCEKKTPQLHIALFCAGMRVILSY